MATIPAFTGAGRPLQASMTSARLSSMDSRCPGSVRRPVHPLNSLAASLLAASLPTAPPHVRDVEVACSNHVAPTTCNKKPFGESVKRLSLFHDESYIAQTKRRSELATMNDRLLNAFFAGSIEEPTNGRVIVVRVVVGAAVVVVWSDAAALEFPLDAFTGSGSRPSGRWLRTRCSFRRRMAWATWTVPGFRWLRRSMT